MAAAKSAKYPYKWPDGTYHSIPASQRGAAKPGEVKISTPNGFIPVSDWDFGYGKGVLQPPAADPTAPGTPAPAGELPLPVDSLYDDDIAGYDRTRRDTKTGLVGERTRGLLDYGFSEDPATKALAFDPNNPFSRASLLKKNYDVSRASTGQNMGSRGQLYAGAYQTAQDSINRGQLGAEDTLQKSLGGFLSRNTGAMTDADTQYENNAAAAAGRRTQRVNDNPLYSPTAALPKGGALGSAAPAAPAGAGAPPKGVNRPLGAPPKGVTRPLGNNTLLAAPGAKGVKKKRKGNTVTYTASTKGP